MQRTSRSISSLPRVLAPIMLLACADVSPEPLAPEPSAADSETLDRLRALGLPTRDVEVSGDVVRVDGDQLLRRDALLARGYERADDDQPAIEKGYSIRGDIASNVRVPDPVPASNIRLAFDGSVPQNVRDAFIAAAGDYNSTANSKLRISQNNTGPTIRIVWYSELWGLANCKENLAACSDYPMDGDPGRRIHIKGYQVTPDCPTWTKSMLAFMARHELGHALGVMHPNDGVGDWIFGTAECKEATDKCPKKPGYPTVMIADIPFRQGTCETSITQLQTDDKRAIAELY